MKKISTNACIPLTTAHPMVDVLMVSIASPAFVMPDTQVIDAEQK